jgi:cell division protein FtsQ
MDGGGRLDQPLMRSGLQRGVGAEALGAPSNAPPRRRRARKNRLRRRFDFAPLRNRLDRVAWFVAYRAWIDRCCLRIARLPPRGFGIASSVLLLVATLGYGSVAGGHVADIIDWLKDARDQAANAAGFRIAAIALTGPKEVSREEVLTIAGVTGHASLLFLDAEAARARLMANPWIADAAVLKLYPDGTVLEPFVEDRYRGLPLLVGKGAECAGHDFLAVVDHYPAIRAALRASVFVAERRWNLRLESGVDVRLPETDLEQALDRLAVLDREKKLLSRDVVAVDLRLPDRVTVRLSEAAAQAREEALKDKKKKKGGDA